MSLFLILPCLGPPLNSGTRSTSSVAPFGFKKSDASPSLPIARLDSKPKAEELKISEIAQGGGLVNVLQESKNIILTYGKLLKLYSIHFFCLDPNTTRLALFNGSICISSKQPIKIAVGN
jgi:hypothetical protein